MSASRNRELLALVPVALLLTVGFAAVFAQNDSQLTNLSLSYGLYFLAICLATHIYIRIRMPDADPYLFPLMALLTAIGLVMLYRLDSEMGNELARDQANWFVIGLVLFAVVIHFFKDYSVLERYRYTIALISLALLMAPRLPLIGSQVNGAYLGVKLGPIAFQPAELAKIGIIVFLASYLREHRELLVVGAKRVLGVTLPPLKHLGPLLVVWGAAMFMLIFIRDLGSSLMFFAAFLALIYVATGRLSFVVIGMAMFLAGAWVIYHTVPHVTDRVDIWLDPYQDPGDAGYQILQSMFAMADGGLFGEGFAQAMVVIPGSDAPLLPAAHTDLIYTLITSELGLFGACAIIAIYLLIAARGFRVSLMASDGFSKLLAAGLTTVFAFQAFVIIGGVTRVIPLTGVTLPLVSYGGSSILANFILLALLLLISDRARRESREVQRRKGTETLNARIIKLFTFIGILFAGLVGFTSWWTVIDAQELKNERVNKRPLFEAQQIKRGRILAADGSVIARSIPRGSGASLQYVREYPEGGTYGHPIGYSFIEYGNSEFEAFHNSELIGDSNEFASIFDELRGRDPVGNDIVTSLDPEAQQVAFDALAGQPGAVVAIEPATGAIRALVSEPPFDPNTVPTEFAALNQDPGAPMVNRVTQGQYPPGSTFKLVTAAAALDSGTIALDDTIESPGTIEVQGNPLANADGSDWGPIDVTTALTHSVNTYFAQLGERIGTATLVEYMERFGFNAKPQLDLPDGQMSLSGVFSDGELLTGSDAIDVGRLAIGQERLLATPIQMAEVAATIANDGNLMRPQIWAEVRDPDGRSVRTMDPERQSSVISAETAAELTEAMRDVVNDGTGTGAALSGVDVAGKTGTAEIPDVERCGGLPNQAWFLGFAPADDPQIAVAATVECTEGQGGTVAAPIAAAVMQALLD